MSALQIICVLFVYRPVDNNQLNISNENSPAKTDFVTYKVDSELRFEFAPSEAILRSLVYFELPVVSVGGWSRLRVPNIDEAHER